MIADELIELQSAKPFQPFEVFLADGSALTIEHDKWMMISPDKSALYYVNREGPLHKVSISMITRIKEQPPNAAEQTAATERK